MATYVTRIQPGVLWVVVDPGVTSRTIGDKVFMEEARPTVTVRAETEVLTKQVILSCGFCQFDETDLVWAIPMGMAKVDRRPLQFGDRVNMLAFVKDDYRDLVCIQPPELHVTRDSLTSIAVFGVVDHMKRLHNELVMSAARTMLKNGEVKFIDVNRPAKKEGQECR